MKQVVLIRMDLRMPKGKLAVQCSHACVEVALKSNKHKLKEWEAEGMKKVVLKVKDRKELLGYKKEADRLGLVNSLIKDAGKTFFKSPTITCLGIGPDKEELIDALTGNLKML